jgi:hypothetical protein
MDVYIIDHRQHVDIRIGVNELEVVIDFNKAKFVKSNELFITRDALANFYPHRDKGVNVGNLRQRITDGLESSLFPRGRPDVLSRPGPE